MPRPRRNLCTRMSRPFSSSWTEEATGELLAWAEYCRPTDGHGKEFERTIVNHLQDSIGMKFSYSQIDNKIRELAKSSSTPLANTTYDKLYKTWGRESMIPSVIKDRAAYKVFLCRVNELRKNKLSKPTTLKTNLIQSRKSTDSRLRETIGIDSPKQLGRTQKQRANSRRYRSKRKKRSKSVIAPEIPPTPSSTCEDILSTPVPLSSRDEVIFKASQESPATIIDRENCPSASDFRGDQHIIQEIRSLTSSVVADTTCGEERDLSNPLSSRASPPCSERCEERTMCLRHDNAYLRQQLHMAQEKNAELEIELHSKETASPILDQEDPESIRDQFRRAVRELENLRDKDCKKDNLRSLIKATNKQWSVSNMVLLQDYMDRIHYTLEDVLQQLSDQVVEVRRLATAAHPEFQALCHRIFGVQTSCEQTISCNYLVQSLISAAVCEWVFERDLKETYTVSCPLMETMLSQVATLDGADVAKTLHFSANYALLNGAEFQNEVIPRRAKMYAVRIRELLGSCLPAWCPSDCEAEDVFKQWQQEDEHLIDIFVHALKVKTHTLVSNEIFEAVFPASRTCVDIQNVQVETVVTSIPRTKSASKTCIVQLSLAPGLRSHGWDRKLVDYHSFRKPGDDLEGSYTMIRRPLVLASTQR